MATTGTYPDWAFGYEKYYDKYSTLSEAELKMKLAGYSKTGTVYPSWLNTAHKEWYKSLKADGFDDAWIIKNEKWLMKK